MTRKLFLLFAGAFVGLIVAEIGLRAAGFSEPSVYVPDEVRGHALLPGARGWWRSEGEAYVRVNSRGLRDREHDIAKPADTLRIAILGDSFTEALQVPLERTYWHLLESELNARRCFGGKRVEVINFGVGGYGTGQQLLTLRNEAWRYTPDIVLLAFFIGNDIRNNSFALEGNPESPYFTVNDGRLSEEPMIPARRRRTLRYAFAHASRYVRLSDVFQRLKQRWNVSRHEPEVLPADEIERGLRVGVYRPPIDEDWTNAWGVTELLIRAMRDEVHARGAKFVLATFSSAVLVHPDSRERTRLLGLAQIPDPLYASRRLGELAAGERIASMSLTESLQEHVAYHRCFLHGFPNTELGAGHWNEHGHDVVGGLIAEWMCSRRDS
jgi:hypothetical protein